MLLFSADSGVGGTLMTPGASESMEDVAVTQTGF